MMVMKAQLNGLEIAYELHGRGKPLLLIQGLGLGRWAWFKQAPQLKQHFRVITFDNRGVGESSKPRSPYTIETMAEDAAALLQHLGIRHAHVAGASMGGMIAQVLALRYRDMVDKLVLACTTPGKTLEQPIPPQTMQTMTTPAGKTAAEMLRHVMSPAFAPGFIESYPELMEKIIRLRLKYHAPFYAWQAQLHAAFQFDNAQGLGKITCPALVITGDQDLVIPWENSRILHQYLPNSRLKIMRGGGHLFFIEQAEAFNGELINFFQG